MNTIRSRPAQRLDAPPKAEPAEIGLVAAPSPLADILLGAIDLALGHDEPRATLTAPENAADFGPSIPCVLLASPSLCVEYLRLIHGNALIDAIRRASRDFALLSVLARSSAVTVLTESEVLSAPDEALTRAWRALCPNRELKPVAREYFRRACARLAASREVVALLARPGGYRWRRLWRDELLERALPLIALHTGDTDDVNGSGPVAWWPYDLFYFGDRPGEPCPAKIDITGRGRILVYGPYLYIAPGRWRIQLNFVLSEAAAAYPYRFEVTDGATTRLIDMLPASPGLFSAEIDYDCPHVARIEIRLAVLAPAFEGHLLFLNARVQAVSEPSEP